jgi:Family of unknown function (DUF6412)
VSGRVFRLYVALLCVVVLPVAVHQGATGTELMAGVAALALGALLALPGRVGAGPRLSVAPGGCAAESTCATPAGRLHQLDPDAAGHPRPRAPGRRTAVAPA